MRIHFNDGVCAVVSVISVLAYIDEGSFLTCSLVLGAFLRPSFPLEGGDNSTSGLTQDVQHLSMGDPRVLVPPSPPPPPGLGSPAQWLTNLLREWLEDKVLQHFELAHASTHSTNSASGVHIEYPDSWDKMSTILKHLGYHVHANDPWEVLGFARPDRPDPSE